ncbi:MAG: NAD(P)-dependent oxidoreductase [Lachnospiraceae bacterium]|nr:NAD(P)-dependent oxidoreductase [Lachnospiraceae bacterium]MCI9621900.1 NAD(P)-dependent oxidoreductase [Lachnospiraceae bacterium]
MERVVVTGATSMIGAALIRECIANHVEVLAIVRRQSARLDRLPQSELVRLYECELDELRALESSGQLYDVFYHFAWAYTSKENRDNPVLQESNIQYTLEAVELAHRLGCRKFVFAGSQAEYGRTDEVITPSTEINPFLSYGIAKYAAGKLSMKLCSDYGMSHIWGRIFSVYGCYDNEGTMLCYGIDQFINGKTARFSAAAQMWDYLFEDDAGKIFYLLGERVNESKVYCIANGKPQPLKEYIMELKNAFGKEAECVFENELDSRAVSLQADVSGLICDIGYTPDTSFEEGIQKMIQFRKSRRNL